MAGKCMKCDTVLGEEDPQLDNMCINCFADDWGEIIVDFPMVSPNVLINLEKKKD